MDLVGLLEFVFSWVTELACAADRDGAPPPTKVGSLLRAKSDITLVGHQDGYAQEYHLRVRALRILRVARIAADAESIWVTADEGMGDESSAFERSNTGMRFFEIRRDELTTKFEAVGARSSVWDYPNSLVVRARRLL